MTRSSSQTASSFPSGAARPSEDQVGHIPLFEELGVSVIQLTYNTQNLSGGGCYERHDTGLSGFGHEVVAEMNRVGVLCDLSHVGAVTSRDVIVASKHPVAYTHILPGSSEGRSA
jgi:membrane dipeptidase